MLDGNRERRDPAGWRELAAARHWPGDDLDRVAAVLADAGPGAYVRAVRGDVVEVATPVAGAAPGSFVPYRLVWRTVVSSVVLPIRLTPRGQARGRRAPWRRVLATVGATLAERAYARWYRAVWRRFQRARHAPRIEPFVCRPPPAASWIPVPALPAPAPAPVVKTPRRKPKAPLPGQVALLAPEK